MSETTLSPIPNLQDYAQCIRPGNKRKNQQKKVWNNAKWVRIALKAQCLICRVAPTPLQIPLIHQPPTLHFHNFQSSSWIWMYIWGKFFDWIIPPWIYFKFKTILKLHDWFLMHGSVKWGLGQWMNFATGKVSIGLAMLPTRQPNLVSICEIAKGLPDTKLL